MAAHGVTTDAVLDGRAHHNPGRFEPPIVAAALAGKLLPPGLLEVCPAGASDLDKIKQDEVIRYVECHAQDWSPTSAKLMCWSLRAFLRYLHHMGMNPHALAGCVPSIRQWKLVSLPTYLAATQVQKVLDYCDRTSAVGRRDFAILMMLSKLGLRAEEVATLTLDPLCQTSCRRSFLMRMNRRSDKHETYTPSPRIQRTGLAQAARARPTHPAKHC